jgi:hypothetical protein
MIRISPTAENFAALSPASDYSVTIIGATMDIQAPKNISASKTINGGASVVVWSSSIAGERREIFKTVDSRTYERLQRIKDSGVDEWLVRVGGKIFTAIFDLVAAVEDKNTGDWRCEFLFVFTGEV